jgi:hypothetical protein
MIGAIGLEIESFPMSIVISARINSDLLNVLMNPYLDFYYQLE